MAATSQTAIAPATRTASSPVPRRLAIGILAIVAATSGVVTTAFALSLGDRSAVSAPGLAPGSRDDYYREGRATIVSGNVGDKWYLEPAPAPTERIRDSWYRQ